MKNTVLIGTNRSRVLNRYFPLIFPNRFRR